MQSRCTDCNIYLFFWSFNWNSKKTPKLFSNRPHPGSNGVNAAREKHQTHTLVVRQIRSFKRTVVICQFLSEPRTDILRGRLSSGRNQTKTGQEVQAQGSEIQTLKTSHPTCEGSKFYSVKFPLKFSIHLFLLFCLPAFLSRFLLIIFYSWLEKRLRAPRFQILFQPLCCSELFMLRRLRSLAGCVVGVRPSRSPQRRSAADLPALSADSVSQGPPIQKAIRVKLCKHTRRRSRKKKCLDSLGKAKH